MCLIASAASICKGGGEKEREATFRYLVPNAALTPGGGRFIEYSGHEGNKLAPASPLLAAMDPSQLLKTSGFYATLLGEVRPDWASRRSTPR